MTNSSPRRDESPVTDGPVIRDHPELEADEVRPNMPGPTRDTRSPLVIAGIVVLVIVIVIVVLAFL